MSPELVELIRLTGDAIYSGTDEEDATTDLISVCLEERTPDELRMLLLSLLGLCHGLIRDIEISEGLDQGVGLERWLIQKGLDAAQGPDQ